MTQAHFHILYGSANDLPQTSLADELAADFDDDDVQQNGNDELDQNGEEPSNGSDGEAEDAMDVDQRAEDPELKTPAFDFNLKADKVTDVAKLINNTKYQQLVQVRFFFFFSRSLRRSLLCPNLSFL
jgi:hypothetical protein